MKNRIAFLLIALIILLSPNETSAFTERDRLIRQIEIIKREISVLQGLIRNSTLRHNTLAAAHIAMDLSDNSVVSEVNADKTYPIASITKLMSAIIATENISPDEKIVLTAEMLRPYGSSPVLFPGSTVSSEDLVKASLIQSTNDASEALSFFMKQRIFIALMNQKAKEIGMNDTIFFDAHGLNPANRSTARDLTKMISYVLENHPELLTLTRENNFWLPDPEGRLLKFYNVNNFYYLSNFIGGKTGYLPEAGQTLASVFNVNGNPTAIIILSSDNRQADLFSILRRISN